MRTRIGIVLTTVVLATAGLVGGSGALTAGAASSPVVTVSPGVGLEDGVTVKVYGNGFDDTPLAAGWRALQCDSGILDGPIAQQMIAHCDPSGPPGVTATGGALAIDFAVHRSINVGEEGRPVTCGNASGDCALLVASGTTTGGFVGVAAPISFGAEHEVTVTPSTGLRDGQTVSVTGTGFVETPAVGTWFAAQCSASVLTEPISINTAINDCNGAATVSTPPDSAGSISGSIAVSSSFVGGQGAGAHTITCGQAPNDCAILVSQLTNSSGFVTGAAAPISFGGEHAVTVTPSTGLRDGQTVTVTGTGFVEHPVLDKWVVLMCSPAGVVTPLSLQDAVAHCDVLTQPGTSVEAQPDGTFSTPFVVHKTFPTPSGTVTCGQAPNDCSVLVAYVTTTGFVGASAPISFAPPVPTLRECIRTFLGDHRHRPAVKLFRLLVCIWTAVANKPR